MSAIVQPIQLKIVSSEGETKTPVEAFRDRESLELVIAVSGPLGCGTPSVLQSLKGILEGAGYEVSILKLSSFIQQQLDAQAISVDTRPGMQAAAARYHRLQDAGNALRKKFSTGDFLAQWATTEIATTRTADIEDKDAPNALEAHVPRKRAFLIDQLKHPAEVQLLRAVYRNLFFVIGILSVAQQRRKRLKEMGVPEPDVALLMERDRREVDDNGKQLGHGQQLDKTLELADFFLRNDRPNIEASEFQLRRFVELMHGSGSVSPTAAEFGMYVAYASSLGSACLSRQVGASIVDKEGNVLATGCNDVPRFGGGLYRSENGLGDARCVKQEGQKCWNDLHKAQLLEEVLEILRSNGVAVDGEKAAEITKAMSGSRLKDLIEFSRAVHAEMEAIISVARKGVVGLMGSTLYTTTFPCHSCARHIVASGIVSVIYIQPYEKSLATELHGDSIAIEPSDKDHVTFSHFEGVAPRRYVDLFLPQGERKKNGVALVRSLPSRNKVAPEYLDSYRDFELQVLKHWKKVLEAGGLGA